MLTVSELLHSAFQRAIHQATGLDADPLLSPSQNDKFGDYQANAAMGLAKQSSPPRKPREVAEQIVAKLELGEIASEISIAGPGFINVRLSPPWLAKQLQLRLHQARLGNDATTHPQTVVVDYSGPNVAKEMHVGHLRSTIIGDCLARVLEFQGHRVIRQNHIGDWGTQFGMLIQYIISHGKEAGVLADLEDFYRKAKGEFDSDPKFAEAARGVVVRLQAGDPEILRLWQAIVEETRKHYLPIYQRLGVKLTAADERGESAYNADLANVVAELKKSGIAAESQGATVVFIDGPEKSPLIIQKSDGGYLYGTTDLAAIRYRIGQLHANRIIYTHDSRQAQHFDQVFRTAQKAVWANGVQLDYAPFGTMLGEDGRPFKTRTGGTVKLKDLIDEAEERAARVVAEKNADLPEQQKQQIAHAVGVGGIKYSDLSKDRTKDYSFSFDQMLALDGNTAPYLQYAHARIRSIFRKAASPSPGTPLSPSPGTPSSPSPGTPGEGWGGGRLGTIQLSSPYELALAKHILRLGDVIDQVSRELKPHLLCTYLYDLAVKFSGFYENCPVLQSEEPLRGSRLALCDLAARTLACGLDLLGIEHPEQM